MLNRIAGSIGIAVALLAIAAASAQAAFPGANGKIAFSSNRDGDYEIYVMNADGTGVTKLTDNAAGDYQPSWSADGAKIAFTSNRDPGDPDCDGFGVLCNTEIYVMNADGGGQTRLTNTPAYPEDTPAWTPDGLKVTYHRIQMCGSFGCDDTIMTQALDGSSTTTFPVGFSADPAWAPDGTRLAYNCVAYDNSCASGPNSGLYSANPDGTDQRRLCCEGDFGDAFSPDWAPDGTKLAFQEFVCDPGCGEMRIDTIHSDGTGLAPLHTSAGGPAWAPDGSRIVFDNTADGDGEIYLMNPDGTGDVRLTDNTVTDQQPDWQPIPAGYARPKGATPFKTYLVVAYKQCAASNRTHGPPLGFPSCAPPQQISDFLTVGTADSNGVATTSVDSVRYDVFAGNPATPADEADVGVLIAMRDIRNRSDLSDYTGELQVTSDLRITDRDSGSAPGTTQDAPLPATVHCAATGDTSTGSVCNLTTSVEALFPGAVKEGKRAIWQLGQVRAYDGGPDGVAATPAGNTLFMDQGVFIP
jgi:Tol biopolymer transport system component